MAALDGRVALVTGAGQGLGAAVARAIHGEGAFVYLADVVQDAASSVAEGLGDGAVALALDVRSDEAWIDGMESVRRRHGRLDVLVNNAAMLGSIAPLVDLHEQDVLEVLSVNVMGVFLGMKRAVPLMGAGSSIVNIASVDGVRGMPNLGPYVASKFAVRGLTRTAALELGPHGIRVNAVVPGAFDTSMVDPERLGYDPRPWLARRTALGRVGQSEEIAAAVVFLASDVASYCTGADYPVDGGWLA